MKSLISLELRKQRKSFWGLLLIIVISLTLVTASITTFAGVSTNESFLSTTIMLQGFGIPFFGLLLGASAGAALRSSNRKAEEDIPVRPSRRILSAYCASLIYLVILVTLLFAVSIPLKYAVPLQEDFEVQLIMVVLLPLHSAAFVFSYWLSQAILGSVVSLIITSAPAYMLLVSDSLCSSSYQVVSGIITSILAFVFFPFWVFGGIDFTLISLNALPGLIATIIHLFLLIWLANRIESEKRTWLPKKVTAAVILLGALSLGIWVLLFLIPNLAISSTETIMPYSDSRKETISCPYISNE